MTRLSGTPVSSLVEEARARVARADNAQCAQMLEHIVGQAIASLSGDCQPAIALATAINSAWRSLWGDTPPPAVNPPAAH